MLRVDIFGDWMTPFSGKRQTRYFIHAKVGDYTGERVDAECNLPEEHRT